MVVRIEGLNLACWNSFDFWGLGFELSWLPCRSGGSTLAREKTGGCGGCLEEGQR